MSAQKRIIYLLIANIVFILACQTVSTIIYPATPGPNQPLQVISNYDGDWQGTTSQSGELKFTITRNELITIEMHATLIGPGCIAGVNSFTKTLIEPTALATGNFIPSHPIQNGTFTITNFTDNMGQTIDTVVGTFSSPTIAAGTWEHKSIGTSCDGSINLDWTAEKLVR